MAETPLDIAVDTPAGRILISDDRSRVEVDAVHAYLTRSYWAEGISRELVARSIDHSLCLGAYDAAGCQVGFARLVTDHATFAYLCDVYVLESHRSLGLGKALIAAVTDHPVTRRVRRAMLVTRDAHDLYRPFGFAAPAKPGNILEINRPDIYRQPDGVRP